MTYFQQNRSAHHHVFYVDSNSGDSICLCGKLKGKNETVTGSKYRNIPQQHNGVTYHSTFEAEFAAELDMKKHMGMIKGWERQVKLDLKINGEHATNYYMDFVIEHNDGKFEFCELKGYEMDLWKLKFKILELTFGDHMRTPDDFLTVIKQSRNWKQSYAQKRNLTHTKRQL